MSLPSHWLVVMNPRAGKGGNQKVRDEVLDSLAGQKQTFSLVQSAAISETEAELAQALRTNSNIRGLIVIGGDGTIHHVAQFLWTSQYRLPIAVIPQGTGNDFSRQLGLFRRSVEELVEHFVLNPPVDLDVLIFDKQIALQVISTGLDASVSQRSRGMPAFLGKSRYIVSLLKELGSLRKIRYLLTIDGEEIKREAVMVAFANGRNYGGGLLISPHSINDDGVIEIIAIGPVGRLRLLILFPLIFSGRHISHPLVTTFTGRSINVDAETIAEADGEPLHSGPLNHLITTAPLPFWRMG